MKKNKVLIRLKDLFSAVISYAKLPVFITINSQLSHIIMSHIATRPYFRNVKGVITQALVALVTYGESD